MTARQKQFRSLGKKPMVVMIYDSGEPPAMYEETFRLGADLQRQTIRTVPGAERWLSPARPGQAGLDWLRVGVMAALSHRAPFARTQGR
jgi:hypothetical protein